MPDDSTAFQEELVSANATWIAGTSERMLGAAMADGIVGDPGTATLTYITATAAALTAFSALRTLLPSDESVRLVLKEIVDGIDYEGQLGKTI